MAPTDPLTPLRSFDDLRTFLEREGVNLLTVDAAASALEMTTHAPPVEGSMAIRWQPSLQLVQLLHPLPFAVPTERLSAVEHALLVLNDALVVPGFCIRPDTRVVYYRLVIPRRADDSIDAADIQRAIITIVTTLRDFWRPLQRVIDGEPPDQILRFARETD